MPTTIRDSGPPWVDAVRAFVATRLEQFRIEALEGCFEPCAAKLLEMMPQGMSPEILAWAEERSCELMQGGRNEEGAITRLLIMLPLIRGLHDATELLPEAQRVSIPFCRSALWIAEQVGFQECRAYCLLALGNYGRVEGQWSEAEESLRSSLEAFRPLVHDEPRYGISVASVLHVIGKLHIACGRPLEAANEFEEMITICRALRSVDGAILDGMVASAQLDFGMAWEAIGDAKAAAKSYDEAIAIWSVLFRADADRFELPLAGALHNRGQLHVDSGQLKEAKAIFEKNLRTWDKLRAQDAERYEHHYVRTLRLLRRIEALETTTPQQAEARSAAPCPCASGLAFKDCHGTQRGPATSKTSDEAVSRVDGSEVLLRLICLLEPTDRTRQLVAIWYPEYWRAKAARAVSPDFDGALAKLIDGGVVRVCSNGGAFEVDDALAQSVRGRIEPAEAEQMLTEIANVWGLHFYQEQDLPGAQTVRAGIGRAVYLRRRLQDSESFDWLERAVLPVACRTGEAQYVVEHMRLIANATQDRDLVDRFDRSVRALARAHLFEGHWDDALQTLTLGMKFARDHRLGPKNVAIWCEVQLELLYGTGQYERLLAELPMALGDIDAAAAAITEPTEHRLWRERVVHHANGAAKALGQWVRALQLNRTILQSLDARGATPKETARYRLNDYAPLLELGDPNSSDRLLAECQQIFESADEKCLLAITLQARGIVASRRGLSEAALQLKRRSLQAFYAAPYDPWQIAIAHDNFANELAKITHNADCTAHRLAAGILYQLIGNRSKSEAASKELALCVSERGAVLPSSSDDLVTTIEQIDGVNIGALLSWMGKSSHAVKEVFAAVTAEIKGR